MKDCVNNQKRTAAAIAYLIGLCLAFCANVVSAQVSAPSTRKTDRVRLPESGTVSNAGFIAKISIETDWSPGYVGLNVDLQSTGGAMPGQRDLRLRITPVSQHFPAGNAISAQFAVPFPQGKRDIQYSLSMPKWTAGYEYRFQLSEDGATIPGFDTQIAHRTPTVDSRSSTNMLMDAYWGNYLFLSGLPKLNRLPQPYRRNLAGAFELGEFQSKGLSELPLDWRLLRHYDFIVLNEEQLDLDAYTRVAPTIRQWVMMGGVLIVQRSSGRPELEKGLGLRLLEPGDSEAKLALYVDQASSEIKPARENLSGWIRVAKQFYQRQEDTSVKTTVQQSRRTPLSVSNSGSQVRMPSEKELAEIVRWTSGLTQMKERFDRRWQRAAYYHTGAGVVISLGDDVLSSELDFKLLHAFLGLYRSPTIRRGVEPLLGDSRQNRWWIPGVAQPPVYTFMGILTLFVLLVGPLAYRWTSKSERLHLMFLIAPLLAALTTVLMFTYSIVSDGFDTKIRVRQITWIDGTDGSAAERSRITLFAGASPRDGMVFPKTAEVLPYPDGSPFDWRTLPQQVKEIRLNVDFNDAQQIFSRAALPSRTQRQFVTHQARDNLGGIRLSGLPPAVPSTPKPSITGQPRTSEASPFELVDSMDQSVFVKLESTLPFDLRRVVARSGDGRYWITKEVPQGGDVKAFWLEDENRASSALGELYNLYRPIGDVSTRRKTNGRVQADVMMDLCRRINRNTAPLTDGVFETDLVNALSVRGDLLPGTFVGLSDPSPDSIPVPGAEVVQSVRYVWGTFRE